MSALGERFELYLSGAPERSGLAPAQRALLDEILAHVSKDRFAEADSLLRNAPLELADANFIRRTVTRRLASKRERDWTLHGFVRTFRFWSAQQKAGYLRYAQGVADALAGCGYRSCLGYGCVLAAIRDGDLIPHDDDLDVLVSAPRRGSELLPDLMSRVGTDLDAAGFSMMGDYPSHRHARRGELSVDIFFGFEEEAAVSWLPGPRRKLLTRDVFPPAWVRLCGVGIGVPANPLKYVAAVYGPDWREPLPGWSHSWDITPFQDWFCRS